MASEVELPLSDGTFCLIDSDDYERVASHRWFANSYGYMVGKIGGRQVRLSRFLLDAPAGMEVDHINRDVRDNRKDNLRICTHSQNQHNKGKMVPTSSRFKGVTWNKQRKRWRSYIFHDGRQEHLGFFTQEKDAARAYNAKALELWGVFACTNENGGKP